jgi:hypothetical protein
MSAPLTFEVVAIKLRDYVTNYSNGDYDLPRWQRGQQAVWTSHYREKLIVSMKNGIDLPKLYIGEVPGLGKIIIDGGHRTRAMRGFMNNEFSVDLDGNKVKVFYSSDPSGRPSDHRRIMTPAERDILHNYPLTVVIYKDLSEKKSRWIFNQLQNAAPMTMPDIINSFESDLIDFLREMGQFQINGKTLVEHFATIKSLPKPDNNEFLYQLLSWFTIVNPLALENPEKVDAIKYIDRGKNRNSKCFSFLETFESNEIELSEEMQTRFREQMTILINFLIKYKDWGISNSDINSFLYADLWIDDFSRSKMGEIFENIKKYKDLNSEYEKKIKKGDVAGALANKTARDLVDGRFNGSISGWIKSRQQAPSGEKNMKVRNEIIEFHCIGEDPESEEELGLEIADLGDGFVAGQGEPVEVVNMIE